MTATVTAAPERKLNERMLDGIEKIGNKVPLPVIMFLYLIAFVALLSAVLAAFDGKVAEEVAVPLNKAEIHRVQDALGGSVVP